MPASAAFRFFEATTSSSVAHTLFKKTRSAGALHRVKPALSFAMVRPARLNKRSDGADVAGTHNVRCARLANIGRKIIMFFPPMHQDPVSGSSSTVAITLGSTRSD